MESLIFDEKNVLKAQGFISGFMHTADPVFIPVGDCSDSKQGYFSLPEDSVLSERHVKNLIVDRASVFMAKRMRPGATWGDGINYLEVGTGVGSGTTQSPQAESVSQTALRIPLVRKAIAAWTYLDANGNATAAETNVIQLTTTFNESEAVGALVEMGLFGGGATVTNGSGYMFNYKTFAVWNKQDGMKLTIIWRLTF